MKQRLGLLAAMGFGYGICSSIAKGKCVPVAMPAFCMQSSVKALAKVATLQVHAIRHSGSSAFIAREHGNRHIECAAAEY